MNFVILLLVFACTYSHGVHVSSRDWALERRNGATLAPPWAHVNGHIVLAPCNCGPGALDDSGVMVSVSSESQDPVHPAETLTYVLQVNNTNPTGSAPHVAQYYVQISALPGVVGWVTIAPPALGTVTLTSAATNLFFWNIGSLAAGAVVRLTVDVYVNSSAAADANAIGLGWGLPASYPSFPQYKMPQLELEASPVGWSRCMTSNYSDTLSLATIRDTLCTGPHLLLACRKVGSATFDVLAAAPRADVFYDTGLSQTPHTVGGTAWYYSNFYSWGFARAGQTLQRFACDGGSDAFEDSPDRLCWHTDTSIDTVSPGYRCGRQQQISDNTWERVIYQSSLGVGQMYIEFTAVAQLPSTTPTATTSLSSSVTPTLSTTSTKSLTASATQSPAAPAAIQAANAPGSSNGINYAGLYWTVPVLFVLFVLVIISIVYLARMKKSHKGYNPQEREAEEFDADMEPELAPTSPRQAPAPAQQQFVYY